MGSYRSETHTTGDEIRSLRERLTEGSEADRIRTRIELAAQLSTGRPKEAIEHARTALSLAQAAELAPEIASAHRCLGFAHWAVSEFDAALEHATISRRGFQALGDRAGAGRTLLLSGLIHYRRESYAQAMADSLEGRRLAELGGDRQGEAIAANQISILLAKQGRHREALVERETSARLHEELGDRYRLGMALVNLGSTHLELDRPERALDELRRGIALLERIEPDGFPLADALAILAKAHRLRNAPAEARAALAASLRIHRATEAGESVVRTLRELGELELECGSLEDAARRLEEGLAVLEGHPHRLEEFKLCRLLARVHKAQRQYEAALSWEERASDLQRKVIEDEQRQRVAEIERQHAEERERNEEEIHRLRYVELERESERRRAAERSFLQSQKLESLGRLSSHLAHDFNNILVGVTGYTSLANELLPRGHPARRYTDLVRTAVERGSDLVHAMLTYAGEERISLQTTQLNEVLRLEEPLLSSALGKSRELRLHLTEPGPALAANPTRLHQLLLNLILNASEAGARSVRVRTGVRELEADESDFWAHTGAPLSRGTYARLVVEDDGEGMDATVLQHLFDPFYTTKVEGRGLGMAAVLGIVRWHAGGVAVRSAVGRGTRFEFVFPLVQGEAVHGTAGAGAGRRLLLVDDDPLVRDVTARLLTASGYDVRASEGGREALALLAEDPRPPFDAILLDLGMPDLDGLATFRLLRERGIETPILFTSGQGDEHLRATLPPGAAFLKKPFDRPRLLEALDGLLSPA